MDASHIRNVAVIAHVDHGKTTLVDRLLYQSGMFRHEDLDRLAGGQHGLIMDSNPLERERGITIFSKNCAIDYRDAGGNPVKVNIIDTPGHADFGGEVERVLSMADGALLLVDAFEGPMPQTRFVLQKALGHGLRPIVLVNKVDRTDARPDQVVDEVFDLLVDLGADDRALDFPVIYASAKEGWATEDLEDRGSDLRPVLEAIVEHVPPPRVRPDDPLRLLVTTLDYSEYVGRIAIGRVTAGSVRAGDEVSVLGRNVIPYRRRVAELFTFEGLEKRAAPSVAAGDICAVVGLDPIHIGDTLSDPEDPGVIDSVPVDEPTLHMTFRVNDGPFAGREGKYVTSRQLKDRLERELLGNVALRVAPGKSTEEFRVSGRGLMHLGILLENMRREGYELTVGKPRVITREIEGETCEPIELLVVDVPVEAQSAVMSLIGNRRAEIVRMDGKPGASGFVHLEFTIPARGLVGLRGRMMTATQGQAIMHHSFSEYGPWRGEIPHRTSGVMLATEPGRVTPYALDALDDRGFFFVSPGDEVYEGQVVGEHNRENDIPVNAVRTKKLTNIRTHSRDEAAQVRPAREMTLEGALEYIQEDELVEVTPAAVRMRKILLKATDRKRESRRSPGRD
ncbi:MAG: translational GTPase TypA [Planctomycetota bacterium]|jgi:GTP-binding protein